MGSLDWVDFSPASVVQNLRPKKIKDRKRLQQTFHKREHPNSEQIYKKVLNAIGHQEKKKAN